MPEKHWRYYDFSNRKTNENRERVISRQIIPKLIENFVSKFKINQVDAERIVLLAIVFVNQLIEKRLASKTKSEINEAFKTSQELNSILVKITQNHAQIFKDKIQKECSNTVWQILNLSCFLSKLDGNSKNRGKRLAARKLELNYPNAIQTEDVLNLNDAQVSDIIKKINETIGKFLANY